MTEISIALAALVLSVTGLAVWRRTRTPLIAEIANLSDRTTMEPTGEVDSLQAADLNMPAAELDRIWSPMHLERLARTYWRFLTRVTLGAIRVVYSDGGRFIVLFGRPLTLIAFQAPEYELDGDRGLVRWRIERGLLVSRKGRGGKGYLQIEVSRRPLDVRGRCCVHVEVRVRSFYPSIALGISRWVYKQTQSRIHVLVTHSFLRSLARLDLAESRVGVLAMPEAGEGAADASGDAAPEGEAARDGSDDVGAGATRSARR